MAFLLLSPEEGEKREKLKQIKYLLLPPTHDRFFSQPPYQIECLVLQEGVGVHHQAGEVEVEVLHQAGEVQVEVLHQVGEVQVVDLLQKQGEVEVEVEAQHHNHLVGAGVEVEEEEERQSPLVHQETGGEVVQGQRQEGWMVG